MNYPVILCGDQIEFEREHANTPAHERPDWPLPSFDARDWAEAFCKKWPGVDQDVMLGWFANALMRGWDEHAARSALAKRPVAFRVKMKNGEWILYEDEQPASEFAESTRAEMQGLYIRGCE